MKKRNNATIILLVSLCSVIIGGCAASTQQAIPLAQSASAGRIGCAPADIAITNYEGGFSTPARSWTATCKGKTYFCSGTASRGSWHDVSCSK